MNELVRPRTALMSQYQREKRLTDGRINLRGWSEREQGRKVNPDDDRDGYRLLPGKLKLGLFRYIATTREGVEEGDLVLII